MEQRFGAFCRVWDGGDFSNSGIISRGSTILKGQSRSTGILGQLQ
jgi:hypothetical protein